jgi:hypothetical protein
MADAQQAALQMPHPLSHAAATAVPQDVLHYHQMQLQTQQISEVILANKHFQYQNF